MTTAHRPTFDPARGKEALRGPAYHQRLLPAYTQLKFRQPGQGGEADHTTRDLRAELEAAEAAHYAKLKGAPVPGTEDDNSTSNAPESSSTTNKRPLPVTSSGENEDDDDNDPESKRRRILAATRDIDADDDDDDGSDAASNADDDDSDDSDDSSDDEDAELARELERVRRERIERREAEERARQAEEQEARERDIALGNPLLNTAAAGNKAADFNIKRRWDDDVVFKNQARGTEEKGRRTEFINDLLRSDFHKRFMSKYVR
ncbi:Pre-mRNA-splicing factor Cwf15/Cwc15 [Parachaetomium inaequale]|uniref:Pre-mRNA-splicing factor Cwf15/Cwc15 n=1 Tax=Parachaetomium inaequale TaxID=2588326 RepID=A0AAN6SRA5_9PEZI|nr:Pre-mRNA-splicing factor Cwf15/Cwc15 [Parachaetomium inaequale]